MREEARGMADKGLSNPTMLRDNGPSAKPPESSFLFDFALCSLAFDLYPAAFENFRNLETRSTYKIAINLPTWLASDQESHPPERVRVFQFLTSFRSFQM